MQVRQDVTRIVYELWLWFSLACLILLASGFVNTKVQADGCQPVCNSQVTCLQSGAPNAGYWVSVAKCPSIVIQITNGNGTCTGSIQKNFNPATGTEICAPAGGTNGLAASCVATGTNTVQFPCCTTNCSGT